MFKNVASQKLLVFAFDSTTNLPKTGDAANITAYVNKDWGGLTVLGDTSATEIDSTNAKGFYLFDLTQAETNADDLMFSAKSSTSNIVVIGVPTNVQTVPSSWQVTVPDTQKVDVNTIKTNPVVNDGTITFPTNKTLMSTADSALLPLRKNTAFSNFEFPMVLSSDHVTPATGKTVSGSVSLDGGAFTPLTNSPTEVGSGVYKVNLAAADLNGNMVVLAFSAAGCDQTLMGDTLQ